MAPFQLFSVCPLLLFSTMTKLISRPNNACLPLNECKGCPLGIMIMITMMMTMLMMMLRQGWPDWWGLVGRQSSYLLLPGHLLLYHQPPPNFGTFCISQSLKNGVYPYSSDVGIRLYICSIWCQCKIVTCFRSYFDLNRFKFVQKIAKSSKRLKREPWPGALLPRAQCCHIHRQRGLSLRSCAKQSPDFLWNSKSQLLDYKSHL